MTDAPDRSLAGKIAIVTGATAGIGLYTALGLAERGAALVVTGRDPGRLAQAAARIASTVPGASVETEQGDFASLKQVRAMGERILAHHPKIAILVNNAGLIMPQRVVTEDGFETTFQVNHLAPFVLTHILLPALKAAAPSRIVTVASMASQFGKIDFDDPNLAKRYGAWAAYNQSKLANIMFTVALARRLDGTGVTAVSVHPGFVASNFGRKGGLGGFVWALSRPIQISEKQGAENSLYAATTQETAGISGRYLVRKKPVRPNPIANDADAVERLWRITAQMTGVAA